MGADDRTPWWQDCVFYQVYPRSFADSTSDGVGDLDGVTAHLDYLRELGVEPTEGQILEMARGAVDAHGGDHVGNFLKLHVEDIVNILDNAR